MNLNDYIASGILELYALESLNASEKAQVEEALKKYPELKEELNRIYDALEQTTLSYQVAPPARLKQSIKQKIEFRTSQTGADDSRKQLRIIRMYQLAVAASLALLLVSGALTVSYRARLQQAEGALALLNNQNSILTDNFNKASYQQQQLAKEVQILNNPNVKRCAMKGVPAQPDAMALVYWDAASKETYVAVKNLPAPPKGMQYQLWAIADGVPLDAGVFEQNQSGDSLQKVRSVISAQAFAVTLEKEGGSEKPTLEKMVVIGNI